MSGNVAQSCVFLLPSSLSITLHGRTVVGTHKTAIGPQGRAKSERETLRDGTGPLHFTDMESKAQTGDLPRDESIGEDRELDLGLWLWKTEPFTPHQLPQASITFHFINVTVLD